MPSESGDMKLLGNFSKLLEPVSTNSNSASCGTALRSSEMALQSAELPSRLSEGLAFSLIND